MTQEEWNRIARPIVNVVCVARKGFAAAPVVPLGSGYVSQYRCEHKKGLKLRSIVEFEALLAYVRCMLSIPA
ncbi:hypothetical protein PA598K_02152 [Paenibacillus sp. 598K]|nr:hypothetical protein PA598K_02152 [Paenibacillus sp. 598K]